MKTQQLFISFGRRVFNEVFASNLRVAPVCLSTLKWRNSAAVQNVAASSAFNRRLRFGVRRCSGAFTPGKLHELNRALSACSWRSKTPGAVPQAAADMAPLALEMSSP
jgi:hypothetical protein